MLPMFIVCLANFFGFTSQTLRAKAVTTREWPIDAVRLPVQLVAGQAELSAKLGQRFMAQLAKIHADRCKFWILVRAFSVTLVRRTEVWPILVARHVHVHLHARRHHRYTPISMAGQALDQLHGVSGQGVRVTAFFVRVVHKKVLLNSMCVAKGRSDILQQS